jgi:hypothetical protein
MTSCQITLNSAPHPVRVQLRFTDFNRLRWAVAALRHNMALCDSIAASGQPEVWLVESHALISERHRTPAPANCHVVLWDGFNSLVELRLRRPDFITRGDIRYLYVGHFDDIDSAFPPQSRPLFGNGTLAHFLSQPEPMMSVPPWVDTWAHVRRLARPCINRLRQPDKHARLQRGHQLVFCGVVRPTSMVLDAMYRGVSLDMLRNQLEGINGLDWQRSHAHTREKVSTAWEQLRAAVAQTHADQAFLFGIHNLLHRMGTLACLQHLQAPLFVNEFDVQTHFDPYDTLAYQGNLFIDFGSTRGIDDIYPRTLDMLTSGKACLPLRALQAGQMLKEQLAQQSATAFWQQCEADALLARQALASMVATLPTKAA